MVDFSNLVGRTFVNNYDCVTVEVLAAYIHDGVVNLIVAYDGGPLYVTAPDSLRLPADEQS